MAEDIFTAYRKSYLTPSSSFVYTTPTNTYTFKEDKELTYSKYDPVPYRDTQGQIIGYQDNISKQSVQLPQGYIIKDSDFTKFRKESRIAGEQNQQPITEQKAITKTIRASEPKVQNKTTISSTPYSYGLTGASTGIRPVKSNVSATERFTDFFRRQDIKLRPYVSKVTQPAIKGIDVLQSSISKPVNYATNKAPALRPVIGLTGAKKTYIGLEIAKGGLKEVQEKPFTEGVIFAGSLGLGVVSKPVGIVTSKALRLIPNQARTVRVVGRGVGYGLITTGLGFSGYNIATSKTPAQQLGRESVNWGVPIVGYNLGRNLKVTLPSRKPVYVKESERITSFRVTKGEVVSKSDIRLNVVSPKQRKTFPFSGESITVLKQKGSGIKQYSTAKIKDITGRSQDFIINTGGEMKKTDFIGTSSLFKERKGTINILKPERYLVKDTLISIEKGFQNRIGFTLGKERAGVSIRKELFKSGDLTFSTSSGRSLYNYEKPIIGRIREIFNPIQTKPNNIKPNLNIGTGSSSRTITGTRTSLSSLQKSISSQIGLSIAKEVSTTKFGIQSLKQPAKLISIPRLKPYQTTIQTQTSKVIGMQFPRFAIEPVLTQRQITTPESIIEPKPIIDQIQTPSLSFKLIQKQKPVLEQKQVITPSIPSYAPPPKITFPVMPVIIPSLWRGGGMFGGRSSSIPKGLGFRGRYTPSVAGIELKIKGMASKGMSITGIGIRGM